MVVDFDRYYLSYEYKKPYNDHTSPLFIALSGGIMFATLKELFVYLEELKKKPEYKKIKNITFSVIPAGTLEHYKIIKEV